jgi:hypothetical protein
MILKKAKADIPTIIIIGLIGSFIPFRFFTPNEYGIVSVFEIITNYAIDITVVMKYLLSVIFVFFSRVIYYKIEENYINMKRT